MSTHPAPPTALIAEDEPLLAQALQAELQHLWPDLHIVANVRDGTAALEAALLHLPNVVLLDIRMPGLTGLEVASALAEDWPDTQQLPRLVFVTAYDQYAVQAFEAQALDYLLKPVQTQRLARTVDRLRQRLTPAASLTQSAQTLHTSLHKIELSLTPPTATPTHLQAIHATVGSVLHRIPMDEVLFFSAADKYVRVVTAQREYLIRTPIKALLPQLDPAQFWQIHRSTVVQAKAVASVHRDAASKVWLSLHQHAEKLAVSRLYTDLFKAM